MSEAILKFIGEKETKRSEMNKKSVYDTTVSKVSADGRIPGVRMSTSWAGGFGHGTKKHCVMFSYSHSSMR